MSEEVTINTIEWTALEHNHREHSVDWYWSVGLIILAVCIIAIWTKSYLFAIFVVVAGASLLLLNLKHPEEIEFSVETSGLKLGKDKYEWERLKSFNIRKIEGENKLLIETTKHFLPVYTIPLPEEIVSEIKDALLKFIPQSELNESQSLLFMEKLGF